jgi:hypothetical protein
MTGCTLARISEYKAAVDGDTVVLVVLLVVVVLLEVLVLVAVLTVVLV